MAKNEYKLQVSKKYPNGVIWLVRGDDLDELTEGLSFIRTFLNEEEVLQKDKPAEAVKQDRDYSQDPEDHDPSLCFIHTYADEDGREQPTQMELKQGKYGAFYSHKTTDEAYNNDPQYDSWFCNGRPPKGQ